MSEPEFTLERFSDEASVRGAFLERSLDLAREIAEGYAEASPKQKRGLEKDIKKEIADFVSGFYPERLFHLRELKEKDLRDYIEPRLTPDQKDLLPQYLDFLKKTTRLVKARINYCAMDKYVQERKNQITLLNNEQLQDKKGRRLQGAALASKIASLIRKKEYGGRERLPTFLEILAKEVNAEIKDLDKAIETRVAEAAEERLGILPGLSQEFTGMIRRIRIKGKEKRREELVRSCGSIASELMALVPD